MKTIAALFSATFLTHLSAAPELHYLAIDEANDLPASSDVPQFALYSGPLDGATPMILSETFTDGGQHIASGPAEGDRTFLSGLFVDPQTGELAVTGLETRAFAGVFQRTLRRFDLVEGGEITVEFGLPARLVPSGQRKLLVWKKPSGGAISTAWTADLPTPPELPYSGPPFPSPDIPLTTSRPWLLTKNASYVFARDEVIVPLTQNLYRLSGGSAAELITPNFNRATDPFGNDDPGGTTRSLLRSVVDQKHGQLYLAFGARDVGVFETRPAEFYDNPDTIGNPHLIQPQELRLVDKASPQFLGRMNLDGSSPLLFERNVVPAASLAEEILSAVDPENGIHFAFVRRSSSNVTTRELLKKPLNRPDSSVKATFSPAQTGSAAFEWTTLSTALPEIVDIEAEPVSRRLYYLLQSGELRSMDYAGQDDRTERQLPASTSAFAIHQPRPSPALPDASIAFIDDLPFSSATTSAAGISADGLTVLGSSRSGDETLVEPATVQINQAVHQSKTGGRAQGLGAFFPLALSGDGRTALLLDSGGTPATWSAATNILTSASHGAFWLTGAGGLSSDGSVIAGSFGNEPGAFSMAGGLSTFGFPAGRGESGAATAVSSDGLVFAGQATGGGATEAFRYDTTNGYTLLGDLPGGAFHSFATAISPDGQTVVGGSVHETTVDFFGNPTDSTRPFAWTAAGGTVDLGTLQPGSSGQAADINDRSTTVGTSAGQAFIHHPLTGIVSLKNFLTDTYDLDLTGIDLLTATGISDDNRTVIGRSDDNGTLKGYVITLPNFPADALASLALLSATADSDLDGINDLFETATGSDPTDAASNIGRQLVFETTGTVCFSKPPVAASGAIIYEVEYNETLSGAWSPAPLAVLEDTAEKLRVTLPAGTRGFVRLAIRLAPPL